MASVMQEIYRTWDVQALTFHCKGAKKDFNSLALFWKRYNNGHQITAYIARTAYSGLTNSARIYEYGADIQLFTVQKTKCPITEAQAKRLEKLVQPSCGKPNCGHTWDNSGMTHVH